MFDTSNLVLAEGQDAEYEPLVSAAKVKIKPETEKIKRLYIKEKVSELVKRGVDDEVAVTQVTASLESGELYGHQLLHFQEHGVVSVSDVLAEPYKFDECSLADPHEPEYHNNDKSVAKLFVNTMTVNSMAHGGRTFSLRETPDTMVETWLAATKIAESIEYILSKVLPGFDIDNAEISVGAINKIVSLTFWDANKSRFFSLSKENVLNAYSKPNGFKLLSKVNGRVFDEEILRERAELTEMTKGEINAFIRGCENQVLDHLEIHNQRATLEMRVDMFARKPRIEMQVDKARIVFVHQPYEVRGDVNNEIIADYKQHFPLIDEVISFIIAGRFTRDRKQCYVWFLCPSDWGKGFFMGLLKDLNASVELSVKEIEKIFEGGPVGRSTAEFKSSLVLVVDEFKTVKSEVKQLQSTMTISPKHQLSIEVEIFTKIFLSAESVDSLVGDAGVEDQFVNRFSMLNLSGNLTKREVFSCYGSGRYFDSVLAYMATEFNSRISHYQSLGKAAAEKEAEEYINGFVSRHGMANSHKRLSESIPDIARDFVREIYESTLTYKYDGVLAGRGILDYESLYLCNATKAFEDWVKANYGQSELVMIRKKRQQVFEAMSLDGKGISKHRVDGTPRDAIKVRYELYDSLIEGSSVVRSFG
mgnify:CR=1 FL=1